MIDGSSIIQGYCFTEKNLLQEALTHVSGADNRLHSNERMEFLGDAILGQVVCEYLFRHYPELNEGDMTKIKSVVVSRKSCASVSIKLGLNRGLNLGKSMGENVHVPMSVHAGVLEAVIAAIYLDGGIDPASRFILEHLVPLIEEAVGSSHLQNYKSVLQEYAQKHLATNPTYVLLSQRGPDHTKSFEICVESQGRRFSSAWGRSKKEAEQNAALLALRELHLAKVAPDGQVILLMNE